ncbi:MAG: HD domain-containing phosphohydrolase [Acidobacteriota bacterium]
MSVCLSGVLVVSYALSRLPEVRWPLFLVFLASAVLASAIKIAVPLTQGGSTLSLSYILNFGSLMVLGPWGTAPIAAASAWSQCTFRMREPNPVYQTLFSMATLAITVTCAGALWGVLAPSLAVTVVGTLASAATSATLYFVVNTTLVAIAVGLSSRESFARTWSQNFLWSAPTYFIGAAIAVFGLVVVEHGQYGLALAFGLPIYLTYRSYRTYASRISEEQQQVKEMSDVQLATIEALAQAIEAKDRTSRTHTRRMQVYAEGLARALGMSEVETRGVATATLLHDIGNLAVPEHILAKTGKLSDEEFERIKIHPRVGAEIINAVPFPYPVAPYILSHHERWDGRGYPAGLRGDEIPLGARIIAVVDCFTAMLTDRPYRPARTYAEAIATLRENGGSTLDPNAVEKFIQVLPTLEFQLHGGEAYSVATRALRGRLDDPQAGSALDDIAIAHLEQQTLQEIAEALTSALRISDVLALVSSSILPLVPVSSCALFLYDREAELFICRHVTGTDQAGVKALTASTVEGLGSLLPASSASRLDNGSRLQSVLVGGLDVGGATIGALALYHTARNAFSADHRRFVSRVSAQAAPVIANAVLFEQTQEQSLTDVLTGLPNRRFLDRQFPVELARTQRHLGHLSVLVLDMDRFKHINDEFGHQAGDRALKEVSHVLRAGLRTYDVCARLAGDEFVVLLGDCDRSQADRRRLELQEGVAAINFEPLPGHRVDLAISVGASTFPEDAQTPEDLIEVADRRMYRDKASRKGTPLRVPPVPAAVPARVPAPGKAER